jgi:hypothetical protein
LYRTACAHWRKARLFNCPLSWGTTRIQPPEVGPLYHHGPEVVPVVELIVGSGLPLAAALWLGGWRSVRARLGRRADRASGEIVVEGETGDRAGGGGWRPM